MVADPVTGPCQPWATESDIAAGCCDGPTGAQVLAQVPAVSDLLYRLSGHRWPGACTVTIRPLAVCADAPAVYPVADGYWVPGGVDATLAVNQLCGCSADGRRLMLPWPQVTEITAVVIAGETLSATAYRVEDWQVLVRQDGGTWPTSDNVDAVGAWTVALKHGFAPPPSGVRAAVAWACEFAQACVPAGDCALPARARTAIAGGRTFELQPDDLMTEGRTGIEAVDQFLVAVNPHRLTHGSSVRSPDIPRAAVTTWPTS